MERKIVLGNMKCYYTRDKIAGKVLIPGCMGVAVSGDIKDCTCSSTHKSYEERISEAEEEIAKLWKKIHSIIEKERPSN